jgi:hypothetical protein
VQRQRDAWAEHRVQWEEGQVHRTSLRRMGVDARYARPTTTAWIIPSKHT